jgi:hypothetical protein
MQTKWGNAKKNSKGYYQITSRKEGYHNKYVHTLVLEEKIGRPLKKNECGHHVDEDKENNDPSNLVVMDKAEHAKYHAIKSKRLVGNTNMKGRKSSQETKNKLSDIFSGEGNNSHKLKWTDIRTIRLLLEHKICNQVAIAKAYDVDKTTISRIALNKSWYDPNWSVN